MQEPRKTEFKRFDLVIDTEGIEQNEEEPNDQVYQRDMSKPFTPVDRQA